MSSLRICISRGKKCPLIKCVGDAKHYIFQDSYSLRELTS